MKNKKEKTDEVKKVIPNEKSNKMKKNTKNIVKNISKSSLKK